MPAQSDTERDASENVISVALVEDDVSCRQSLVAAIARDKGLRLAWQASSLEEAMRKSREAVDVLLVDLGLPDGSGLDLIAQVRQTHPLCLIMVSTVFGDDRHLFEAIKAGALGYLLKDVGPEDLVEEIRNLRDGGSPINPMLARKLLLTQSGRAGVTTARTALPDEADPGLSLREKQVLQWIAKGHTLEEVAGKLGITRHTARSFIRRIYQKLNVNTRAEAVKRAFEHGLLK